MPFDGTELSELTKQLAAAREKIAAPGGWMQIGGQHGRYCTILATTSVEVEEALKRALGVECLQSVFIWNDSPGAPSGRRTCSV